MSKIINRYFGYRSDFTGPLFILYRGMFEKDEKWGASLGFITEQVFDVSIGKWLRRGNTLHHDHFLGNSELCEVDEIEARQFFENIKDRREYLIQRAKTVSEKQAMVIDFPLGRWDDQWEFFPYVQTVRDKDGAWLLEVCSNKYLRLKLNAVEIKKIRSLGFNNPDLRVKKPNFWKLLPAQTSAESVVDEVLVVLEDVFQLGEPDNFDTEFPMPEYFQPAENTPF